MRRDVTKDEMLKLLTVRGIIIYRIKQHLNICIGEVLPHSGRDSLTGS